MSRFEREPQEENGTETSLIVEKAFEALEKLDQGDLERIIGRHLSASRLQEHAEGRINFESSRDETLHIALCDVCGGQVIHLEEQHLARLHARHGEVLDVTVDSIAKVRRPAGSSRPEGRQSVELLCSRALCISLAVEGNDALLVLDVDDPGTITNLNLVDSESGKDVILTKSLSDKRLEVTLVAVGDLVGRLLNLSFSYGEQEWLRRFRLTGR